MGRLNLTSLQLRRRALANLETERTRFLPVWVDVLADIPPAQIMTRQQPIQHPLTKIRARTISPPSDSDAQLPPRTIIEVTTKKPTHSKRKASRVFQPVPIRYEEDELRKQFYSDHPWELARPRVVLETSGDNSSHRDYSRNVRSPNAPLNGESVVQRQLHLLHNVPNITDSQAYDIARKEFYAHRLREDIERRVAVEEAEAVGAVFGPSVNDRSIALENKMCDDWERWSRQTVMDSMARNAAFAGRMVDSASVAEDGTDAVEAGSNGGVGDKVFGGPALK
jgi:small subunit ribosomal protein S23